MNLSFYSFRAINVCLVALLGSALLFSCNSDSTDVDTPADDFELTEEQAAQLVETALQSDAQGLTADMETAAREVDQLKSMDPVPCSTPFDSTYNFSFTGNYLTANYSISTSLTAFCDGPLNLISFLEVSSAAEGSYTTSRMQSEDSSTGHLRVGNIIQGTAYVISGTYSRTGTQIIERRNRSNSFNTQIDINYDNISINKFNFRIEGGQANFTISGSSAFDRSIDIVGEITFLGDGQAIVIINGNQYQISL